MNPGTDVLLSQVLMKNSLELVVEVSVVLHAKFEVEEWSFRCQALVVESWGTKQKGSFLSSGVKAIR